MKNSLMDLNNYLFEAIERINDDDLTDEQFEKEVKRSEVINKVASTIVNNANLVFKATSYAQEYGDKSVIPRALIGGDEKEGDK